jgi:hypothetical protein
MNTTERETQIAKLKMLQMINTYLSVGILVMLFCIFYGVGWTISQIIQYLT